MEKETSRRRLPLLAGFRNSSWYTDHGVAFRQGLVHGFPIALGYLAVSFTLGIAARGAGLTAWQAMLASLLNNASAGEYVGFTLYAAHAALWELAVMTLVANARYLLMCCALGQRLSPDTPLRQRLLLGFGATDEIFGISVARPGKLDPWYSYGAMAIALPCWAAGTAIGVVAGSALPQRVVSALSVALYGMFLAVIIPPARKNRIVAGLVALSFAASYGAAKLPVLTAMSSGTRTILLTIVIAGAAAVLFPVREEEPHAE
jgi:predicted branched-subunit amino acid permease